MRRAAAHFESMKLLYKPFGFVFGILGGIAAASLFKRVWRALGREDEAPAATDRDRTWRRVIIASAAKGAVFGAVRAATERSGAAGFAYLTGTWPGKQSAAQGNKATEPVAHRSAGRARTRKGRRGA